MKVSDYIHGLLTLIYNSRGPPRENTAEYIFGNLRFAAMAKLPFTLPPQETTIVELAIDDVPVEVWKIIRSPEFVEVKDEGQEVILAHSMYLFLVSSDECTDTKGFGNLTFRLVSENPVSGDMWRSTVFSLADPACPTKGFAFHCFTNIRWRRELQEEPALLASERPSRSVPIPVGHARRNSYSEQRTSPSVQVSSFGGSQPLNFSIGGGGGTFSAQFVGSLSGVVKPGTSPGSFCGPVAAVTPRLSTVDFPSLIDVTVPVVDDLDELRRACADAPESVWLVNSVSLAFNELRTKSVAMRTTSAREALRALTQDVESQYAFAN